MKKAISVLLAVVVSLSQLALCAEAASDNPLKASDRITTQLAETLERKQEAESARIQRDNMKDAAIKYGATADTTNVLGFMLNRKTMTKREYEAFKWSFIISQFAIPLEDSLLDVFEQKLFNTMIEKNMDITSVENYLNYGGVNPDEIKVNSSMLQNVNFPDLVETIKSNYSLLSLYKLQPGAKETDPEGASPLHLTDVLYGSPAINERYYVFDSQLHSQNSADEVNWLYYNQAALADITTLPEYSVGTELIPVAVYDASFFFYLQTAVGIYCMRNSISVTELEALYGSASLVMDSYGNICIYTATGAKILMPNFGNTLLTAKADDEDGLATAQILLYNKWVTTLYTRMQRSHVGDYVESSDIFGGFEPIALGGNSKISYDDDTLEKEEETSQETAGQYVSELPVKADTHRLSNTMLLVDPADINGTGTLMSSVLGGIIAPEDIPDDVSPAIYLDPVHNSELTYPIDNKNTNAYLTMGELMHSDTFTLDIDHNTFLFENKFAEKLREDWSIDGNRWRYAEQVGTLYSSVTSVGEECVFTHPLTSSSDEKFINPYPIINIGVNTASMDGSSNSTKTHYYKLGMSLKNGKWRFASFDNENTYHEQLVYSSSESTNKAQTFLQALNNCAIMVTTFIDEQLVGDLRFSSARASKQDNGTEYTELYLPFNVINIGQNCNAFIGEEKGMFVTKHKDYFSSSMESFRETFKDYFDAFVDSATGKEWNQKKQQISWYADGGKIAFQSGLMNNPKLAFTFTSIYDQGIPVALHTTQTLKKLPYYSAWEPATITIDGDKVYDYSNLADFLGAIFDSLPPSSTKIQLSSAFCGNIVSDDSEEKHDIEEHKLPNNCWLTITNSGNTQYTLELWTYDDNSKVDKHPLSDISLYKDDATDKDGVHYYYWTIKDSTENIIDVLNGAVDEANLIGLFDHLNLVGACGDAYRQLNEGTDRSISEFKANLESICAEWDFDVDEFLYAFACFQHGAGETVNTEEKIKAYTDVYFFDEYEYLLRNTSELSEELGCQDSMDLAAIAYYWDRAYLPEVYFNKIATEQIYKTFGAEDIATGTSESSPYQIWLNYEFYLKDNNLRQAEYSFLKYLEDHSLKNKNSPFINEFALQTENLETYINNHSSISEYFDFPTQVYNYLAPDTIVFYPCYEHGGSTKLVLSSGIADMIAACGYNHEKDVSTGYFLSDYNTLDILFALQCNTDYEHNYLKEEPVQENVTHVTKEELMDKANQFFDNPVTSLEYIMSGFLYKMHTAVATGSLGSVFSANWLLESSIYKWIIDRYIAIVTIIITILLLIKLTQFAMSKTHNYASIGRAVACILAMCMVPLAVFNGFIWAFNKTSQWALAAPTNKMLLSETNATMLNRVNSDPGVTAEFNAFREQFEGLGIDSTGIAFDEMEDYALTGPIYRQISLSSYLRNLEFGTNYTDWYSSTEFVPVQAGHYDESMFYYFYDYIRAQFFNYLAESQASYSTGVSITYINILNDKRSFLQNEKYSDEWKDAVEAISSAEKALTNQTGEFISMLSDTNYVYATSIVPELSDKYGGAYAKDLAGVYNLFQKGINKGGTIEGTGDLAEAWTAIKNSPWRMAMNDAKIMTESDGINPRLWTDQVVLKEFIDQKTFEGGYRGPVNDEYPIVTSKLDLFNPNLNSMSNEVDTRVSSLVLTPLEEKLCEISEDIYNSTLKALEYHRSEIKNESAIALMAWIATFKVSEAFGIEPAGPIQQTVTLDTVIRTAFIKNLDTISANTNTMYAMIAQGDSIARVFIVLILETTVAVAGILRIFIILYLTVGSFVVLALRLLHKAPQTTDLVYGIVFNILALLALHALTLFLVVCAVEWVATATSSVPNLVLDLVVIAFIILMFGMLFKLVKNLLSDAINLGGARIKAGVHSIVSKVANLVTQTAGINALASELNSNDVNLNADRVDQELNINEQQDIQVQDRRERIESTLINIERVEEATADNINSNIVNAVTSAASQSEGPSSSSANPIARVVGAEASEIALHSESSENAHKQD